MKGLILGFFRVLKFPLWLLTRLVGKKRKKRSELEEKRRKYVRNFAPVNYSWQKSIGKKQTKKRNRKFSAKKTNNSKG